jgi:methylamine dehydrogenase accessory protein MauD
MATQQGLEIGTPAPDFHSVDIVSGREVTLGDLKGRPSVLIFISPSCGPCHTLMPHMAELQRTWGKKGNIILVSQADHQSNLEFAHRHKLKTALISDSNGTVSRAFQAPATPFAYRLDKKGKVQWHGIASDLDGLEALTKDTISSEFLIDLPSEVIST